MRLAPIMLIVAVAGCAGEPTPAPARPVRAESQVQRAPQLQRAPPVEPAPEAEQAPQPPPPTGRQYLACGCGCCGTGPTDATCVASEEALQQIIDADEQQRHNPGCAVRGCSLGTLYRVCE